jgi:zinc D-Ala-D-Ala carboxypeptidase
LEENVTQLTPHFSLAELTASATAQRLGIDNTPPPNIVANLLVAAQGMEGVRTVLGGKPIRVTSGHRCEALNHAVGGAPGSGHKKGWAIDFTCPDFGTPVHIVRAIAASDLRFDKCIQEGTWVHISFAPPLRRILLIAHFAPGKPTTYSEGVA